MDGVVGGEGMGCEAGSEELVLEVNFVK